MKFALDDPWRMRNSKVQRHSLEKAYIDGKFKSKLLKVKNKVECSWSFDGFCLAKMKEEDVGKSLVEFGKIWKWFRWCFWRWEFLSSFSYGSLRERKKEC